MKTKIPAFIAAIAFLLLGTSIIEAQNVYFKKNGVSVFQSAVSGIDSIVFRQELSEEEITEFYTNFEDFVNSPGFHSYNTIDESKSALGNWLRQQPNVEDVTIEGNVLTITFKDGEKTAIKILEATEPEPNEFEIDFEYGPETVDAGYFTSSSPQNVIAIEQSNTKSQSEMRAATDANEFDYIYPVFWEPYAPTISFASFIDDYYISPKVAPLKKQQKIVYKSTRCNPLSIASDLTYPSVRGKPNLIFINTHGYINSLIIGRCRSIAEYNDYKTRLKEKNITISNIPADTTRVYIGTTPITIEEHYFISVKSDDLKKLLENADFNNAIVFLNACSNLTNNSLADVFLDRGARGVFGYSGKIDDVYVKQITGGLLNCLLSPGNKRNLNDLISAFKNVYKSPKYPQSEFLTLRAKEGVLKFRFPPIITLGQQNHSIAMRRINATQEQGVAVFGGTVHYYSPAPGYSKSYYGFVYSSETNNPKVGDGKSKLVDYELDHDIYEDEIYILSSNHDIEYNKQYYYRAFICSIYNGSAYIYYADEVEPFMVEGKIEDILNLSPNEISFNKEGGTGSFSIETNLTITDIHSSDNTWCKVDPNDLKNVIITAGKNETPSPRTATITVATSNTTKKGTVTVTQEAGDVYITLSTYEIPFIKEGDTKSFTIETNLTNINVSSNSSWCRPSKNPIDSKTVNIVVDKNKTVSPRTAIITVGATNSGITATVTVTQEAGDPYITLTPTILNFKKEGETLSFNIESNLAVTDITSSRPTWCRPSRDANDPNIVNVEVDKNDTTSARNAIIWVTTTNPEVNGAVSIQQEAGEEAYITLTPTILNFKKEGETLSFNIESNLAVTDITSSRPTWCRPSRDANNPNNVNVEVDKNDTTSARNAIIWVTTTNPEVNGAVSIQQEAGAEESSEWVLINGVKWATRNVGASSPEDYGNHYQWNKGTTDFLLYKDYENSIYCNSTSWLPANDPSPAGFRVPTEGELSSLANAYVTTIVQNGVFGLKITDTSSGESIFLPAAGSIGGYNGVLGGVGSWGQYWCGTQGVYSNSSDSLDFDSDGVDFPQDGNIHKSGGFSIRPVVK